MKTALPEFAVLLCLLAVPAASWAREYCDAGGSDAGPLAVARASIDAACPCDAAVDRIAYRRCARASVRQLIADAALAPRCGNQVRRDARASICGRAGAVVCCRVDALGRPRHRVVHDAAVCRAVDGLTTCVSPWQSVVTGCDDSGCVAAICGNGVVESGEQCDPPSLLSCDGSCQARVCEPIAASCGDGVVEGDETCEPPGVASCGRDCRTAPCASAQAGEIDVACVEGETSVSAAATSSGYLLAWKGPHRRDDEVLARRFDAAGAAADEVVTVASDELECWSRSGGPSAASDGDGYYLAWPVYAEDSEMPGAIVQTIRGRRLGGVDGVSATDQLAMQIPIGTCRTTIGGPTATAAFGPARFAAGWQTVGSCYGSVLYRNPVGALMDFSASPVQTAAAIGFPIETLSTVRSSSAATVAGFAGSALWVWHATVVVSPSPLTYAWFVAGAWSEGSVTTDPFALSARQSYVGGARPAVAAGSGSLLVVWSQGASEAATAATEIRAVRVNRDQGRLDPDGGLLLATVATQVTGGPVAAFDGARWLVVWAQSAATGEELRALTVDVDGMVQGGEPRWLAGDVAALEPAAASAGDGRVLVAFVRQYGTHSAVRATLVED